MAKNKLGFHKNNPSDKTIWVDIPDRRVFAFTFDKKKIFLLFRDYPYKLTPEEKEIFDKENTFWVDFFKHRTNNNI